VKPGNRATPYVASLRLYEPATAFTAEFLQNLISYPALLEGFAREEFHNLANSIKHQNAFESTSRAFQLTKDGVSFYCPWSTGDRLSTSISLLRESYSNPMLKLFSLSPLEKMEESFQIGSLKKTYILTENWLIPPRWFSLFSKGDSMSVERKNEKLVLYRTNIDSALFRGNRALSIVRKTFGPGPLVGELEEMMTWLSTFDSRSVVELDYGGLANLLNNSRLPLGDGATQADTSVADVWESLEALEVGDAGRAGAAYERLMRRWRAVSSLEHAN
jgi:hypothetical protein